MSIIQPLVENMQKMIPDLPGDWAEIIGQKIGMQREQVRAYANGRRGKRNKQKVLDIHQQMKTLHTQLLKQIEKETA